MALESIVLAKRRELFGVGGRSAAELAEGLPPSDRDFYAALAGPSPAFVLEVKPRSPSAGALRDPSALDEVIAAYHRHASVVSVLADREFFGGSPELVERVRARVTQPVLWKDVVVDPVQVTLARRHGADAVLLMLSVLDDATYRAAAGLAERLGMGVLTEVHDHGEMARAIALGARVIGINNRNLRTLRVELETTRRLAPGAPADTIVIAESGIEHSRHVDGLRDSVDGFLVGSAVMKAPDPDRVVRSLVFGETKVCGLTRPEDAAAARDAGATHGGLVFASGSPRLVSEARARSVVDAAELAWVGVFVNPDPREAGRAARRFGLAAVQLHGEETPAEIAAVRRELPPGCRVWKALPVGDRLPPLDRTGADLVLLDAHTRAARGGTGTSFDWRLLDPLPRPRRLGLAGGLDADNVWQAASMGLELLDVSSGVEAAPGQKDRHRLARFFARRRGPRRARPTTARETHP
ncbi:MAG: bifunctional indole-3-glycerol-phosphate synthase TrpC/phosphoribosylanthranilate isomerase TrpF [Gemmatimonadales bacterium]